MCVCKRLGDLCRRLDRFPVVELARAHRLAQRAARDVLVRDVDMRLVAGQREDPLAVLVPKRGCRARLALGPVAGLSLASDDLQCDIEPALLVAGEPHLTHPAGAEGSQRPVPAEEEVVRERGRGHLPLLRCREENPCSDRRTR